MTDKPTIRDDYEARLCPGIPTDCCDYGVISHATGIEVCRVWQEDDARLIASLLNESRESSVAELQAEVERLRKMLYPRWFYHGDDQSSDNCRGSVDDVIQEDLIDWGVIGPGKHVVEISTATPCPTIWALVEVLTNEQQDARDDDERFLVEEYASEADARAALAQKEPVE